MLKFWSITRLTNQLLDISLYLQAQHGLHCKTGYYPLLSSTQIASVNLMSNIECCHRLMSEIWPCALLFSAIIGNPTERLRLLGNFEKRPGEIALIWQDIILFNWSWSRGICSSQLGQGGNAKYICLGFTGSNWLVWVISIRAALSLDGNLQLFLLP